MNENEKLMTIIKDQKKEMLFLSNKLKMMNEQSRKVLVENLKLKQM